jgi:hypothetical protein
MKKVPAFLFAIIIFFLYDDIWFTYEEYPIIHMLLIVLLSIVGLIYAIGQGPVVRQIAEIVYESIRNALGKGKDKL